MFVWTCVVCTGQFYQFVERWPLTLNKFVVAVFFLTLLVEKCWLSSSSSLSNVCLGKKYRFFFVFGSQFFSFSKLIDDDPWESNSYFVSLSLILSTHYLFRWSSSNKIDILDQQRGVNWCWNNKNDQTNNKKH